MASKKKRDIPPRAFKPGNPSFVKVRNEEGEVVGAITLGGDMRAPYAEKKDVVARDEYLSD